MKIVHIVTMFLIAMAFLNLTGCNRASKSNDERQRDVAVEKEIANFWGHGTRTFISDNLPNGYKVSVFYKEKDNLCIWHFQRGDSIDRYIAEHRLPLSLSFECNAALYDENLDKHYEPLDTTLTLTIDIPIVKQLDMDAADGDICFMDVDFDGQEEFIIAHSGYNRTYYACFNLVNGDDSNSVCPGFLTSMNGEVYGNLVGGLCGKTEFDHKKKIIHVTEQIGCCVKVEAWAKPIKDIVDNSIEIKMFKKIENEYWMNGEEHIMTYQLVNDSLKQVSHEIIK